MLKEGKVIAEDTVNYVVTNCHELGQLRETTHNPRPDVVRKEIEPRIEDPMILTGFCSGHPFRPHRFLELRWLMPA